MARHDLHTDSKGFTIIELLIATAVFSTVLVIVTTGILQFSRVYYKGVTEANTQSTARSVIDTISQSIQFGGGPVIGTPTSGVTPGGSFDFCVGNLRYSYRPGFKLVDSSPGANQTNHSLIVQTISGCSGPTGQDMTAGSVTGRELMSPNMRLADMTVEPQGGNLYRIHIRVVFGDDDLLNNPTATNASCKGTSGRQFCAVSDLSTIVVKRVE